MFCVKLFLAGVFLARCGLGSDQDESVSNYVPEMHAYLNDKILNFKRDLMKALIGEKVRGKRRSQGAGVGKITTQSPAGEDLGLDPVTCLTRFQFQGQEFLFVGGVKGGTAKIIRFNPAQKTSVSPVAVLPLDEDAERVAAYVNGNVIFLIISYPTSDPRLFLINTDSGGSWTPFYSHQVSTNGRVPSHFEFFTVGLKLHMLVTYEKTRKGVTASGSDIFLWNGVHMDQQVSLPTVGASSAAAFPTHQDVLLVVAQYGDVDGNNRVGSKLFRMRKSDGDVKLVQNLVTDGPLHVRFFAMSQEIYLTFANQFGQSSVYWWVGELSGGRAGTGTQSVVSGDQFILWQKVPDPDDLRYRHAWRWEVIEGKEDPSLALALKQEIVFFVINTEGQFSPYSVISLASTFAQITKFFFIRTTSVYMVVTGGDKEGRPLSRVYSVETSPPSDSVGVKAVDDPLVKCMNNLHHTILESKSVVEGLVDGLPNIVTGSNVNSVNGSVEVTKGVVVSGETFATDLVLENATDILSTPADFSSQLQEMRVQLEDVAQKIPDLLHKNDPDPTVYGKLATPSIVAEHLYIDNIGAEVIVNNISMNHFLETRLRDREPQVIEGDLNVRNLVVDNLEVKGKVNGIRPGDFMTVHGDQIITGNHKYSHVMFSSDVTLKPGVTVNGINLNDVVRKDVKFQIIEGQKSFSRLSVLGNLEVQSTVNGRDLSEWVKDVVTLDSEQQMYGDYHFEKLHVQGDVQAETYSGINVQDLFRDSVKLREPAVISGPVVHKGPVVVSNLNVEGRVNGVRLWDDVLTVHGKQDVKSRFVFKNLKITGNLESPNINGLDFGKDVVTINGSHVVHGNVVFNSPVSIETPESNVNQMFETDPESSLVSEPTVFEKPVTITGNVYMRTLNGYDILNLHNHFWTKSASQKIDRTMTLSEASVGYSLEVERLNGHRMSEFVHRKADTEITGPIRFEAPVIFHSDVRLGEGNTIDGVDLSELQAQAVWRDSNQVVTGKKRFLGSVFVLGNVSVEGEVNGKSLDRSLLVNGRDNVITGKKTIGKLVVKGRLVNRGDLLVESKMVNGYDFTNLTDRLVYIDEPARVSGNVLFHSVNVSNLVVNRKMDGVEVEKIFGYASNNRDFIRHVPGVWQVRGNVRFDGPLTVLGTVNGVNYLHHLNGVVRRGKSAVITGKKVFTGVVEFKQDIHCSTVNNIDLRHLESRILSKTKDQVITGHYTFLSPVTVHNLLAPVVDNVSVEHLVFDDGTTLFRDDLSIQGDVVLDSNVVGFNGLVNGCNLTEIALRLRERVPTSDLDFSQVRDLQIIGDVIFKDTLNGVNVDEILSNLVTKDDDQEVTGLVNFEAGFAVDNLYVKTINGMDFNHFMTTAMRRSTDQILTGVYEFRNTVSTPLLSVKGDILHPSLINGLDLSELAKKVLTPDNAFVPIYIGGHKKFPQGLKVNNLIVDGHINDLNPERLIFSGDSRPITEEITFEGPVTINGNLLVEERVDGVLLDDFISKLVTLDDEQVIHGDIVVHGDLEVDNLDVVLLNDVTLSDVVTVGGDEVITGHKHFKEATIDADIVVKGSFNGIRLAEQQRKWAHVDRNEIFTQPNVFIDDVYMYGNVRVKEIDGVKVESLPEIFADWKKQTAHNLSVMVGRMKKLNEDYIDSYINSQDSVKLFNYFDFFQVLSFKGVREIHAFSVEDKHKLITIESDPVCHKTSCSCFLSRNLEVSSQGKIIVYDNLKEGKVFPFLSRSSDEAFFLWSNSTADSDKCDQLTPDVLTVESFHLPDLNDIRKWSASITLQKMGAGFISDVEHFSYDGQHYLVVARFYDNVRDTYNVGTQVYSFDAARKVWNQVQSLETMGTTDIDVFSAEGEVYLVVANSYDSSRKSHECLSVIYRWSAVDRTFLLLREVKTIQASAVLGVSFSNKTFIFISQKSLANPLECFTGFSRCNSKSKHIQPVLVLEYRKVYDNFYTIGSLEDQGVTKMTSFVLTGKLYVAMCSPTVHAITVYQYKGVAGFLAVQSIPMYRVDSLATYEYDNSRYLIAGSPQKTIVYKARLLTVA